ncbi:unnamed protein product [[Candida] boidinii]|nr:unnamed protein product [[Candida] boidinii]
MGVLLEKDTLVNELVNSLVERKAGDGDGENEGDGELVLNKESSLTLSLLFPQIKTMAQKRPIRSSAVAGIVPIRGIRGIS